MQCYGIAMKKFILAFVFSLMGAQVALATDFTLACYDGNLQKAKELYAKLDSASKQDNLDGCLESATSLGPTNWDVAQWALSEGANPNQFTDYANGTPFGVALISGKMDVIEAFLKAGAKIDHDGCSIPNVYADLNAFPNPCMNFIKTGSAELVSLIYREKPVQNQFSLLWLAIMRNERAQALSLLAAGVDPGQIPYTPRLENNALFHLILNRDIELITKFLDSNAILDFTIPTPSIPSACGEFRSDHISILGYLASKNDADMLRLFLTHAKRPDVLFVDDYSSRFTSVLIASAMGNNEALNVLLGAITDPERITAIKENITGTANCEYANALQLAAADNKVDTLKILLEFGWIKDEKTRVPPYYPGDGYPPGHYTALDLAQKFNAQDAETYLRSLH